MRYVVRAREAVESSPIGRKARSLAALGRAGLPVPPWFALTPEALFASLPPGRGAGAAAPADFEPAPEVEAEIRAGLAELAPAGEPVAVRSSADDEDGAQQSFAGQLDSFLGVRPADVPGKVAGVWRSAFADRALAYRSAHGLPAPRPPAVLVQLMVDADVSGVAFGADPVSRRRDVAVVAAVPGLGTALVSGECDGDTYHVDLAGAVVRRTIAARRPALTDAQAAAVADLARRSGSHFGCPQDVEWALAGGELVLLQSRPITALARPSGADGPVTLWDNSNISESYAGVTTPLTFSFARRAYEEVYREFCRLLLVPAGRLAANADVFRHMLGLVRGRVYYNLLNWYRVLALLPGFRANRRFMEQMMGVREGLPDVLADELARAGWLERLRDRLHMARSLAALIRGHFALPWRVRAFDRRLADALAAVPGDLAGLRPDELAACYRELERRLLARWDAPLLNDFLAMVFHGVLGKLTRAWCGDAEGRLRNDLLAGAGGLVSAEPAARVRALAEAATTSPPLTEALCAGSRADVERAADGVPAFRRLLAEYLAKFADRCPGELKLESLTLDVHPMPLFRSVGELARRPEAPSPPADRDPDRRREAERRARAALGWRPLRRLVFRWVLRNARTRLRDRENLRFGRTRLFGKVRRLFAELGDRFHALGVLDHPRDVFYLEAEEAWGFLGGTASCTDLRGLARVRKAEFDRHRQTESPAGRFETRGIVPLADWRVPAGPAASGDRRQGLGCCPGVVRGPVRVVADPRAGPLRRGEVLVAERTDPGWVMLFPAAAGLLVERGSLLSHSAVVARELGVPAVVSVPGLTGWLQDGDWVELDGGSGVVTRVAAPAPPTAAGLVGTTDGK